MATVTGARSLLRNTSQQLYTRPLTLEFLAPAWSRRDIRTIQSQAKNQGPATQVNNHSGQSGSSSHAKKETVDINSLHEDQRKFLDSALRVNQAGELAAIMIYQGQTPPIVKAHPHLKNVMKHMYDQEAGHYKYFNEIIAKHRIRPTAMYPIWAAAASILGWGTGVMGREAAMACTEAVETEIGNHYNDQVRVLLQWKRDLEAKGAQLDPELASLMDNIRRIRDEELEHLDHAVEHDAKLAKPYEVLNSVIRYGCRAAIKITERI